MRLVLDSRGAHLQGFGPQERPCDLALGRWLRSPSDDARAMIGACNVAADRAWTASRGGEIRTKMMEAAAYYGKLLQSAEGILDPHHYLVLHARGRLATVMTASGVQRSRANAYPLWKAVLDGTRPAVPENWPTLLESLAGLADSAAARNEDATAQAYLAEASRMRQILGMQCLDVARQ